MYKNKLRIAIEGGETTLDRDRHKRDGDNYEKGQGMKLKLCPKCRVVWEWVGECGHIPPHAKWYPVLPRYGKPEFVCPRCEGNNG